MTGTIQQAFPKLDTPLVELGSGKVSGEMADLGNGHISIPWYRFLISLWSRTGGATGANFLPIGVSAIWNGDLSGIPDGCLVEDGTAISRTQNSALFSVIGTRFGAGDGFSTFNLPNRIGKFTYGGLSAGPVGGADSVAIGVVNLPPHAHPVVDPGHLHAVTDPGHAHGEQIHNGVAGVAGTQGTNAPNDTSVGTTDPATTGLTVDLAVTGITTGDTGTGIALPIIPPYLQGIPIIGAL